MRPRRRARPRAPSSAAHRTGGGARVRWQHHRAAGGRLRLGRRHGGHARRPVARGAGAPISGGGDTAILANGPPGGPRVSSEISTGTPYTLVSRSMRAATFTVAPIAVY